MDRKVAVIGLDGMAWHILDKLFEYGAMPTLKRFVRDSLRGVLESTIPPTTPPAWTSIASGVNPGKHGVFNFLTPPARDDGQRILTSNDVAYPRLHEMVALKGLKSVCVNQPLTYPIFKLKNTRVVSDWMSPTLSHYPKLLDGYAEMFAPYFSKWAGGFDSVDDFLYKLSERAAERVTAVNAMIEELDWTLLWVVYSEPDQIFHRCYDAALDGKEPVLRIFEKLDETIKKAEQVSDLVVVTSDHGFAKYRYAVYVNSFLHNLGLNSKLWRKTTKGIGDFQNGKKSGTMYVKTPGCLYGLLSRKPMKVLLKRAYRLLTGKNLRAQLPFVNVKQSKAYMSQLSYGIYAKEKEYVSLIVDELSKRHYIDRVWRREELYYGPFADMAPDVLFSTDFAHGYSSGAVTVPDREVFRQVNYNHHPEGIVIIYGDEVDSKWIGKIAAVDIAPTILNYLGLPVPNDTDGKYIEGVPTKETTPTNYNYLNHWLLTKRIYTVKRKLAKRFS